MFHFAIKRRRRSTNPVAQAERVKVAAGERSVGCRKAIMRRMAELGMGNQSLKSVSGRSRDDEVALYTCAANRGRMAEDVMNRVADWKIGEDTNGAS